ncbi:LuxR C-terminal-related transcriptional regulator [Pseudonocardia halophobica]|uniref:LuxR C-terminal-related transcriptional regulator n=1 Tax=Pseudonocardia halophobica TaxID=29401 RepID=UPI003D8FB16B
MTSKEVAAELFLTAKTVDHHPEKVNSKLGIPGRRELRKLRTGNSSKVTGAPIAQGEPHEQRRVLDPPRSPAAQSPHHRRPYGMTEVGLATVSPPSGRIKPGSVGQVVPDGGRGG